MHAPPKKIIVNPNSEVARLLDKAAERPLLLEKDGVRYRLNREEEPDIWGEYDAKKVEEAIAVTAGSWSDIDADAVVAALYRAREEGSRPLDRP
jgi:hypothetical protein